MDTMMEVQEVERSENYPDIHALFWHFNDIYFDDALGICTISWSSSQRNRYAGDCCYLEGDGCEIRLSESLKFCNTDELKNTLLHEMIHAFLYVVAENKDHSYHGPDFTVLMDTINSATTTDSQRPPKGYNITTEHKVRNKATSRQVDHRMREASRNLKKRERSKKPSHAVCRNSMDHEKSQKNSSRLRQLKIHYDNAHAKITEQSVYGNNSSVSYDVKGKEETSSRKSSHTATQSSQSLSKGKRKQDELKIKKFNEEFPASMDDEETTSPRKKASSSYDFHSQQAFQYNQPKSTKMKTKTNAMACGKKRKCNYNEEKSTCNRYKKNLNVGSACLLYYNDEESEEDIPPLINKRTERRKKEKLLKEMKDKFPCSES